MKAKLDTFVFSNWVTLIWIHNKVTQFKNIDIGSVTNNNGFWIRWLDLLTSSSAVSLNHNQLQSLTINLQPNTSFLTEEDPLHSCSRSTTHLILFCTTYIVSRRTPWETPSLNNSKVCLPLRCLQMDVLLFHGTLLQGSFYWAVAQQRVYMSQYSCDSPDDDLEKVETCSATLEHNECWYVSMYFCLHSADIIVV
jgi:hypothetical protein